MFKMPATRRENFLSWKPNKDSPILRYLKGSNIHGFQYIGEKEQMLLERIFWICCLIVSACFAGSMINDLIIQPLKSSPVLISYDDTETTIAQVPFPAVTICDTNIIRKQYWEELERKLYAQDWSKVKITGNKTDKMGLNALGFLNSLCISTVSFGEFFEHPNTSDEMEHALKSLVPVSSEEFHNVMKWILPVLNRCKNTILKCLWAGTEINCRDSFYPVQTEYGMCCVFNMMPPFVLRTTEQVRKSAYDAMNVSTKEAWASWDIDEHLIFPSDKIKTLTKKKPVPKRQTDSGAASGLSVLLNSKPTEHFPWCKVQESVGFRVQVHSPIDNPLVSEFGKTIKPNTETFLGVQAEVIRPEEELRNMKLKRRRCYYQKNYNLTTFKFYTQNNCFDECLTLATIRTCSCILFHMPRINNTIYCNTQGQLSCVDELWGNVSVGGWGGFCPRCWPACTSISYRGDTTQLPLRDDVDLWKRMVGSSYKRENMSLSIVHIFFNKNEVESRVRKQLYGIENIVGDTGGFFGLTLGISMIALAEPIYLIMIYGFKIICGLVFKILRMLAHSSKNL